MKTTSFIVPRNSNSGGEEINPDEDVIELFDDATPLLGGSRVRSRLNRSHSHSRSSHRMVGLHSYALGSRTVSEEEQGKSCLESLRDSVTVSALGSQVKIVLLFVLIAISTGIMASVAEVYPSFRTYAVTNVPQNVTLNWQPGVTNPAEIQLHIDGLLVSNLTSDYELTVDIYDTHHPGFKIKSLVFSHLIPDEDNIGLTKVTKTLVALDVPVIGNVSISMRTSWNGSIPIGLDYRLLPYKFVYATVIGAVILFLVYILIIVELVHRAVAAILGSFLVMAVLAFYNMRPGMSTILTWLDIETLNLLFGMMVIVSIFTDTGFFDWMALMSYKLARGQVWVLLTILCTVAAVVSAFLDNVTTILLIAPVTIRLCEALRLSPQKLLLAEVIFSNIGGTSTAVGDPPNVLLVSNADLKKASGSAVNFVNFLLHLGFGSLFVLAGSAVMLRFLYRGLRNEANSGDYEVLELCREVDVWRRTALSVTMTTREEEKVRDLLLDKMEDAQHRLQRRLSQVRRLAQEDFHQTYSRLKEEYYITDKVLLGKTAFVLLFVIISFVVSSLVTGYHVDLGWIALLGAIWLLILADTHDLEVLFRRVEWSTLVFFAALFSFMEGIQAVGLIDWIGDQVVWLINELPPDPSGAPYTKLQLAVAILLVQWVSALVSSFVDNIPFTTAMIPVILSLAESGLPLMPLVWALAFGTCLGGNGTLIGASANVVAVGIADQHDYPISFCDFFKVGFPIMLVSSAIATVYLMICHVALDWNG